MPVTENNHKQKTITLLLKDWQSGNAEAFDRIMEMVYSELKGIAGKILADKNNPELGATLLVNEAYRSLVNRRKIEWGDRRHFFNFAAKVMRCQVMEEARRFRAIKRGGGQVQVDLEDHMGARPQEDPNVMILLDELLKDLEKANPEAVKIFELRYFIGCTVPETASISEMSPATVKRKYDLVKAWLYTRLKDSQHGIKSLA